MREQRDRLDEALDAALASYVAAPRTQGLEQRVLARVMARTVRTPIRRSLLMFCTAAAAIWLLVWLQTPKAVLGTHQETTTPPAIARIEARELQTLHAPAAVTHRISANGRSRRAKKPAAPKLAVFPTPSAASSEERALSRFAALDAEHVPRELTHLGQPIEPIQIAEVEIKPIE